MNSQFKKGVLELLVLAQLSKGDKYGYELTEAISKEMQIATGTLYLILKRLKDEEYFTTYLVEAGSGPARKYYSLSEKGRAYYLQLLDEWQRFIEAVDTLLSDE